MSSVSVFHSKTLKTDALNNLIEASRNNSGQNS